MLVNLKSRAAIVAIAASLSVLAGGFVMAQIEGPKRGIAPIASSGDFEVFDIEVNETGDDAADARKKGWEEAQRLAWSKLWANTHGGKGSSLSDSSLDGIVSAIVVQEEQIGPKRYVGKLGVVFDRARAGQLLGVQGIKARSAPLLIMPITFAGGSAVVYEQQNMWQRAWALYKTSESRIDYVRPSGAGGESLLLNAGQIGRRSRQWWRIILDQFGAADVVFPIVRLERQWPGGPIVGKFTARYGPDNRYLGGFTLRADNSAGLNAMLEQGVAKLDELFQTGLSNGRLRADVSLVLEPEIVEEEQLEKPPEPLKNEDLAKTEDDIDRIVRDITGEGKDDRPADDKPDEPPKNGEDPPKREDPPTPPPANTTTTVTVQVSTPSEAELNRAESSLRSIPGVKSVSTSSLALGGTSVLRVTYQGDPAALNSALRARGF